MYKNRRLGDLREGKNLAVTGREWFIDAAGGNNGNDGRSWDSPRLTMASVFDELQSGDVITFVGKIREQLTTPVQVFDVTIRGGGNRPRHADAEPDPVGGSSASTWAMPLAGGSNTTPLLKIIQQGWRLENFVMAGPTTAACLQLFRDGGAGDDERDASHAEILGVRFASGRDGIEQSGGCYNVHIEGCSFHDLTGYCLKNTAGAGIAAQGRWQILNNRFSDCAYWAGKWDFWQTEIIGNTVVKIGTPGIDTSDGTYNVIVDNRFDIAAAEFDPAGGFTPDATDVWSNILLDAIETGVPAN